MRWRTGPDLRFDKSAEHTVRPVCSMRNKNHTKYHSSVFTEKKNYFTNESKNDISNGFSRCCMEKEKCVNHTINFVGFPRFRDGLRLTAD